ncbi:PilC/PilY family type IV pilus protein [uncultured Marinobacter sp.]|uniref:pilus assembly protein n=1 Tax=uncultured Marinobacter sp. TaxID=187379 RepID=UPI002627BE66|nr:PilC/PilY family type IV pilus protein [uncultured Marinobacter sp.]
MKMNSFLRQGLKSSLVAMFLAWPAVGWSASVTDRPLFIDASVDHNLMFVVDDSGSMDYEIIAPKVGEMSGNITSYYLFNPGSKSTYEDGRRLYSNWYDFKKGNYFLRSSVYNYQYYEPTDVYEPWPSGTTTTFAPANIEDAMLDPGFGSASKKYDLTKIGDLDLGNYDAIPATFFIVNDDATVYQITKVNFESCSGIGAEQSSSYGNMCYKYAEDGDHYYIDRPINVTGKKKLFECGQQKASQNQYKDWSDEDEDDVKYYYFEDSSGQEIPRRSMGFAPDGSCIQRLELVEDQAGLNKSAVYKALGGSGDVDSFFTAQQQNFANWFSYYRRRHQVIRGAIGESVKDLESMRLGIFWINDSSPSVSMYDSDTSGADFLDANYGRFVDGTYKALGTPNREALDAAGQLYADKSVRGTLECRKSFTLLFTDGYSSKPKNNWSLGNKDKNADAPFGNSNYSSTLGDIAYYYNQGLRTSGGGILPGGAMRVPSECGTGAEKAWMDCNTDFHMNTYTVALGMTGNKFAGLGYSKVMDAHKNPPNWGLSNMNNYSSTPQIDDLYHAAVNGKGEYYDAKSTTELVSALKNAIKDVQQQLGSGSNVSFNTTSLKSGGYIFSAQFVSQVWTGTLRAEAIDKNGTVSSQKWDAGVQLNARDLSVKPRLILTHNGTAGTEFKWTSLTQNQKNDLKAGGNDTLGKARLSYIQGNKVTSAEGVVFRERTSRLGAIVNSAPVYVGEPNYIWPDQTRFGANPYSAFKTSKKNRTAAVYVGANDGMLHGFDADTGEELIAYIPEFLYSTIAQKGLSALTDPALDYQSYVDLPLNTSDVYTDGAWRTVVIGGSRGATPGLFALDVTDPAQFSSANASSTVMWEFSGNNDLGHMTDAAQIALLKWAANDYRWSAVFSNGYGAPSGKNGLFVIDIEDPSEYKFIELASGGGLSPARLVDNVDDNGDPNSDGVTDRVYAGDLEGRLWAIDLTGGKSAWAVDTNGAPLFVAKDNLGNIQPITSQPDIARNTYKTDLNDPNLLVFFGTGKYLEAGDIPAAGVTPGIQTFYGLSDRGTSKDANGNGLSRDDLSQRAVTTGSVTVAGVAAPVRKTDGAALDWAKDFGWYMDLPSSGERVVEAPIVRGSYVVFASTIPVGGDPCGGGGSSFLTALQLDGSTDSSKSIIDVNNDGKLDSTDQGWAGVYYGEGIITGLSFIDNILMAPDSSGGKTPFLTNFGAGLSGTRRVGWHEITD